MKKTKSKTTKAEAVEAEVVEVGENLTRRDGGTEVALADCWTPMDVNFSDLNAAEVTVRRQYVYTMQVERAAFAVRIEFGAMLFALEKKIGESRGGFGSKGRGLKGWLSEHLPELSYATAQNYKRVAIKGLELLGGGPMALAALTGAKTVEAGGEIFDVPGDVIERRDRLFTEATSRRKLEQMWFGFAGGSAGRPKGTGAGGEDGGPVRKLSRAEEAKFIWNRLLQETAKRSVKDAVPLLGEAETRVAYDTLGDVRALLKRHLDELAGGAR